MRISIIIPALNEEANILSALSSTASAVDVEAIVVDGGSMDATAQKARSWGARVVSSPKGRASQMNAGARAATGETLLFLHADTLLPERFDIHVRDALSTPSVVAGAFLLHIDETIRGLRTIERMANWRSKHMRLPYGDQALFLRADLFRKIGGFAEIPIMEDFELMARLRKRGRISIASASVTTSGRRWKTLGVLKTTIINQAAIAAYCLGVRPAIIAGWYYRN